MEYREFTTKELAWISKLQGIMKQAPNSLFMFVGAGAVVIYPKDENGERYMKPNGSVDGDAPEKHAATKMDCDGGDW